MGPGSDFVLRGNYSNRFLKFIVCVVIINKSKMYLPNSESLGLKISSGVSSLDCCFHKSWGGVSTKPLQIGVSLLPYSLLRCFCCSQLQGSFVSHHSHPVPPYLVCSHQALFFLCFFPAQARKFFPNQDRFAKPSAALASNVPASFSAPHLNPQPSHTCLATPHFSSIAREPIQLNINV